MRSVRIKACGVILLLSIFGGCARSPEARRDRYITRGKQYLQKHDYTRAILEFKNAARVTPDDAEVYYQLGLAFGAGNDLRMAIASFQQAVALNPKHTGAQLKISQLMAATDDPGLLQDAQKRLKALLDGDSPTTDVLNSLALAELKLGQTEDAIRSLERALTVAPGELNASVLLAGAKLRQNDAKGAEQVLQDACVKLPKSGDARRILGDFYLTQGRLADAQAQFQLALSLDPKNGGALNDLARAQLMQGQKTQAEQSFRTLAGFEAFKFTYGQFLFQENRRDEAIREFERIFKDNPEDRQARTYLLAAYKAAKRSADLDRILDAAIKKNSRDADALLERGEVAIDKRDFGQAERDLNICLKLRPESPDVHYVLARLHDARGETLSYRQDLAEAVRLNPALLPVRLELSQYYIQHNEGAAALDVLNATPPSQKSTRAFVMARNWALWAKGDMTELRKGLDVALSRQRSSESLTLDGFWKLRTGNLPAGRASIEEALKIDPTNVLGLQALNQSYQAEGKPAVGLEKIKQYAALSPKSAQVQELLGEFLLTSGDRKGARAAFTAAKAATPQFVQADLSLAKLDVEEGKMDDARTTLERLASSKNTDSVPSLWLGILAEMKGDDKTAIEHFRKVVDSNPDVAQASNNLAYLLAEHQNNLDEALKYAQRAVELAPDVHAYSDTLGWVLYKKGLYSTAVKYLERAGSDPSNIVWKYHLAMAYAKSGDRGRGRTTLEAALKVNQNVPEAKAAREVVGPFR